MPIVRRAIKVVALGALLAGRAAAQHPAGWNPTDSIRLLPDYRPAHDTLTLLAPARIGRHARHDSAAWMAYLARSRAAHARDTASMHAELRAVGSDTMSRAPYAHDFDPKPWMTGTWLASDSARALADVVLTYQAPNGGWSKHVDFAQHPRRTGESYYAESNEWGWISTLDNGATTQQIELLACIDGARPDPRYEAAARRGIEYLLAALELGQ
jgi:Pectic acid lyase